MYQYIYICKNICRTIGQLSLGIPRCSNRFYRLFSLGKQNVKPGSTQPTTFQVALEVGLGSALFGPQDLAAQRSGTASMCRRVQLRGGAPGGGGGGGAGGSLAHSDALGRTAALLCFSCFRWPTFLGLRPSFGQAPDPPRFAWPVLVSKGSLQHGS